MSRSIDESASPWESTTASTRHDDWRLDEHVPWLAAWRVVRNSAHLALQDAYSVRNMFVDRPVWLRYTNDDLIRKSHMYIRAINPSRNSKVLDVGCGNGVMLLPYLKRTRPANIYGIDRSEINIAAARRRLPDVPCANLMIGDITHWNPSKAYDIIVMHCVLGYVTFDRQLVILETMARSLRKKGTIIMGAVNFPTDPYIFQTYPIQSMSAIRQLCMKWQLSMQIYDDKTFDDTGKYDAHTIMLTKTRMVHRRS
jgi:ubiquinone/menaquinone biosynthesis C-methylase UbiE